MFSYLVLCPTLALPTYEECVMGKVQIKEEKDSDYVRGNLVWAPMYTTYQFPTGPAGDGRMLPMGIEEDKKNQISC